MDEEDTPIKLPMLLEMTIQHHNKNEVGAVRLAIAHADIPTLPPIFYQLYRDDVVAEEKAASHGAFFVRKAGKYKMIGTWKDGSKEETQVIELTDGMFTADGWDGLTPAAREKGVRVLKTVPPAVVKKGWFS